MRVATQRSAGWGVEGRGFLFERIETPPQVDRCLVREAGPDLSGKHEALLLVVANQQRPNARAHPFRIREAADHEFLLQRALGLEPVAMPSVVVGLIAALGD